MWKRENEPGAGPSPAQNAAPGAAPSAPRSDMDPAPAPRPAHPSGERAVLSPRILLHRNPPVSIVG